MHDEDIPPEEKEKWNLDRERDSDALKDYVHVDRVIGMQNDDEGEIEYLIKCKFPVICSQMFVDFLQGRVSSTSLAPGRRVI